MTRAQESGLGPDSWALSPSPINRVLTAFPDGVLIWV